MNRIAHYCCLAALGGLALLLDSANGGPAAVWGDELAEAQIELAGNDVLAGLEHTGEFIKDGQWSDAATTLARIMENHGRALIEAPVSAPVKELGFARFITVSEHCQQQLASWHVQAPEALAAYRRSVDELARQWYEEALASGSESRLQRIVDELLLSSSGDQALMQLGELALERGNYTLARRSWERLSPQLRVPPAAARLLGCVPGCSWWTALQGRQLDQLWPQVVEGLEQEVSEVTWLAYPDTDVPLAAVRARLILVSLLQGDRDRAELEFEILRRLHPDDEGEMAGQQGKYTDLLASVMSGASAWPAADKPVDWTTLGGCMARNGVADQGVDVARQPVWQTVLPRLQDEQDLLAEGHQRVGERADGLLSYHVATSEGVAFVLQSGIIRAIEIATGQPAWRLPSAAPQPEELSYGAIYQWSRAPREVVPRRSAHAGVPRYSVTIDGGRLFARMGTAWAGGDEPPVRADQRSFLVGIDLQTQKLIFDQIPPGEPGWEFESSPVVNDTHLFVGLRRRDPTSAQVRVACFSIATGRVIWQRDVLRGEAIGGVLFEIANSALTLNDDTLYYNTNLGAVVALRLDDGRVQWIYRYRRAGLRGDDLDHDDRHWARDQTPCLVHHDLLIVAPADCSRIFALDAGGGEIVWATAAGVAADAVHLVGVGHNHLLACGDYLYWIDLYTGKLKSQFPAPRSALRGQAGPAPRGYGRAVLAGDQVFWPTYEYIYVFQQSSCQQVRQPIELGSLGLTGGNLVIDRGTLMIAGADRLTALNTWGQVVEDRWGRPIQQTDGSATDDGAATQSSGDR